MDINDLGKLQQNKQPFRVTVLRALNWRNVPEVIVTCHIPMAPRGEKPLEVSFDFKHPALFSLLTTKNLLDSHGITYELDDHLAVSGSESPDAKPGSLASQKRQPCKTCGKTRFKTSRNCLNPSTHGNKPWTCLLELGNWREPADRADFIHRNGG